MLQDVTGSGNIIQEPEIKIPEITSFFHFHVLVLQVFSATASICVFRHLLLTTVVSGGHLGDTLLISIL